MSGCWWWIGLNWWIWWIVVWLVVGDGFCGFGGFYYMGLCVWLMVVDYVHLVESSLAGRWG